MEQKKSLKEQISCAPDSPGVYLFSDAAGTVLYVGKAASLKKRLQNYLGSDLSSKTMALMCKVAQVELRLTPNEMMALLLESKLVHELKPRYNISLKDDKSFPLVEISADEYPALRITRKKNPLNRYLGPYTNAKLLKSALKIIRQNLGFRSCRVMPKQSCIYYRINLCPGPCAGKISPQDYQRRIEYIELVLSGRVDLLIHKLTKSMQESARTGDFESAARKRDQISALSGLFAVRSPEVYKDELGALQKSLGLDRTPERIEGFDISNLSGKQAVGSMVSFFNGSADKNNYRRFRIKSFSGIDDYKMLAEVLRRRYTRLLRESRQFPGLILIDGGKGHLLTGAQVLAELKISIPMISIAKEKENIYHLSASGRHTPAKRCAGCHPSGGPAHRPEGHGDAIPLGVGRTIERGVDQGQVRLVRLPEGAALNLIRRVRDEAHRFALAYHHLLRRKSFILKK